jgi:hypothetical protein
MGGGARAREGDNVKISKQALAPWRHQGLGVGIATWLMEAGGCVTILRKECWIGSPHPSVTVWDLSGDIVGMGQNFEVDGNLGGLLSWLDRNHQNLKF